MISDNNILNIIFSKYCKENGLPVYIDRENYTVRYDPEDMNLDRYVTDYVVCGLMSISGLVKKQLPSGKFQYYAKCNIYTEEQSEQREYNQKLYDSELPMGSPVLIKYNLDPNKKHFYKFNQKQLIDTFKSKGIEYTNKEDLIKLADLYLSWRLKDNTVKVTRYQIGWKGKDYSGITCYGNFFPETSIKLFNKSLEDILKTGCPESDNSQFDPVYNDTITDYDIKKYSPLLSELLLQNPKLLILMSYCILAISNRAFTKKRIGEEYEKYAARCSALCICGTNKYITATAVANLFANMLKFGKSNMRNIPIHSGNLNTSCINLNLLQFMDLRDITLLVYSKDSDLTAKNKYVKSIMGEFLNGTVNYYPVFISAKPFNVQECFDLDISDLKLPEQMSDNASMVELKNFMNGIYIDFIMYIKDAIPPKKFTDESEKTEFIRAKSSFLKAKKYVETYINEMPEPYSIADNMEGFYCQLMFCTFLLEDFLIHRGIVTEKGVLISRMKKLYPYFCDCEQTREMKLTPGTSPSPIKCFKKYLKEIFVDKTYVPEYTFYEGEDSGEGGGYCYYIDGNQYFSDFKNKYNLNITKRKFNVDLRKSGIIKRRLDNKSMVMVRKIENKKQSFLVILRDKL